MLPRRDSCAGGGGVFSEIISVFIISPTIPARFRDIHARLAGCRTPSVTELHARSDYATITSAISRRLFVQDATVVSNLYSH